MIVSIDIQSAIARRTGVGRYTKSLVEHLGTYAGDDQCQLFYFDFKRAGMPFPVPGASQRANRWFPGRVAQGAWKTVGWPPYDWFAGSADVYHFPNFVRPPLTKGRSVVTIHDAAFMRLPETTEEKNLRYLNAQVRKTVAEADAIITNSKFTAHELEDVLNVSPDKLFATPLGLSEHVQRPDPASIPATRKRLGIERPYLLTVGTIEPRKNMPFLVEVFEQLKHFDGDLVIAGMLGWKYEEILKRMQTSSAAARIRYLDYVDENDLPGLYAGAEAFLFPSLYEGFGFPPLEAMSCGTPVIASHAGALPEVLGDAAELVDMFDVDAWTDRIYLVLDNEDHRNPMIERGTAQAAKFTWDETARLTWDVYRTVAD